VKARKLRAEVTTAIAADVQAPAATARHAMIAEAAYFLAEKRGFASGLEQQDWFAAEQVIEDALRQESSPCNPSAGGRPNP